MDGLMREWIDRWTSRTEKKVLLCPFIVSPAIVTPPQEMNVSQQIEVVIPCVSSGIPEPEITWYKTEETGETEKQLDSIGMCYI